MSEKTIEKIIPIVNMDCASCAKTIEKELMKILGIEEVKINILLKRAKILFNPDLVDIPQIEGKIESIGYRIGYKKYKGILEKIGEAFKKTEPEGPRSIADHEFEEYVLKTTRPVIVEFASTSCPSCKLLGKVLREIGKKYLDRAYFYQMDINTTIRWKELNVMSAPTLVYFKGGVEISRDSGLLSRDEIVQRIETLLN